MSPVPPPDRTDRLHEELSSLSIIQTVADRITPGLSARDRSRMDRLHRAVKRLNQLIQTEADELRRSTATPATATAIVDVEALVREVCALLQGRAEESGVRLVVECEGGVLRSDRAVLKETLLNLVGNAIDVTGPGRVVRLETKVSASGDQIWTIEDSGTGMPPWLMLSASIAMSHGGSLAFESRQGGGTTVRVWLPQEGRKREARALAANPVRFGEVVELRHRA